MIRVRDLALIPLAILAANALADTFSARVVAITDGDTITVLDANKQQHKIRFNGIDAPESRQPFGTRSTQNLARYVGLAQITDGMAWWFRRYADEQTAEDRGRYESAENEARLQRRGLWRDTEPVPPWERRRTRSKT